MRKIKIGYLADGGDAGGARTHILTLLSNLNEDEFEIYFFSLGSGNLSHSIELYNNVKLTVYPLKSKMEFHVVKDISRWIEDNKLDIIHTHGLKANLYGRIAALKKNICLLTTYHSNPIYDYSNVFAGLIFTLIDQLTLFRTNNFIAVSYEVSKQLEKRGISRDRITIIKNGINPETNKINNLEVMKIREELGIPDTAYVIGSLGRMVKVKGYSYMLECFKDIIYELGNNVYLLLIGSGEEEENLKKYASSLEISDNVKFVGFKKDPYPYIEASDIMFFTPEAEALGIAILESMNHSKPIVSRKIDGISEIIIDNYNGYIKDSKKELVESCLSLLRDKEKRDIFVSTGHKTIEKYFNKKTMIDKTTSIYKNLIKERVYISDIPIDALRKKESIDKAYTFLSSNKLNQVVTLNIEMLSKALKNPLLGNAIKNSELVLPDGVSMLILGRRLSLNIPERIPGVEYTDNLLKIAIEKNLKVYFLGGTEKVSSTISEKLKQKYPSLNVAGSHHGYFGLDEEEKIISEINESNTDILFVGMGAGKQEIFIYRNKTNIKAKIAIGVGGSLDVLAGMTKRAPDFFIKLNLEWLYRVLSQPNERIKRLLDTLPTFFSIKKPIMKKILISGYYGYGNIGDESILKTLIRDIKKTNQNKEHEILVLTANPHANSTINEETHSVYRFDFISILKEIFNSDYIISGGGGLIQDVTSWKSPLYYLSIIALGRILGKKVLIYANGIGPLNYEFNKFLTALTLKSLSDITVRDIQSVKILNDIGINNTKLTVDPIFSFDFSGSSDPYNEYNNFIAVSIGKSKLTAGKIDIFAEFLDYVSEKTGKICLFTPFYFRYDYDFSKLIMSKMKSESKILITNLLPQEMLSLLLRAEFCIGMRLHFIIYSSLCSKPTLPILYDPKVEAYSKILEFDTFLNKDMDLIEMKNVFDTFYSEIKTDKWENLKNKIRELKDKNMENEEVLNIFLNDK